MVLADANRALAPKKVLTGKPSSLDWFFRVAQP
jgi:hypothetical protein